MAKEVTWYPGIGANEKIARLERLVGRVTAHWAEIEDSLFTIFVFALAGTWAGVNFEPYRAIFYTFGSYENKMRMLHNAMKARFSRDSSTMTEWLELRRSLNAFSELRNEIAHLIPRAKYSEEPDAEAIVRLAPPFWKPGHPQLVEFEQRGYSWEELTTALAPFWGFDPSFDIWDTTQSHIALRLNEFHQQLQSPSKAAR